MQPKLFIDTYIENFNEAHEMFEAESKQFFTFHKNMNKWDCFAKSETHLKVLHKMVG